MKRSEIEAMLDDLASQEERVANVLEKLDAGVTWDPEEEPLPEKLTADETPGHGACVVDASQYFIVSTGPGDWYHSERARGAVVREMVRRYNLFPELGGLALELEQRGLILGGGARFAAQAMRKILESGKP